MSYIDYMNQFNVLDQVEAFDLYETRLYIKLLAFFNDRKWQQPQQFADTFLCMATGIKSVNGLKKARAGLMARGIVEFEGGHHGAGKKGEYRLRQVNENGTEKLSPNLSHKLSYSDSLCDSFSTAEAEKLSPKLSQKLSSGDTNIKSIDKKIDVTERGASATEKKIVEADFSPNGATASAPHTGGGAAPAAADEPVQYRGGFVDPRLSDDDPRKWEGGRPKDAAMVDEYLASHHDPEVSKHAGKGHLFFDYYDGFGWCAGEHGKPIRNWRAVARQFSYIDYKANRQAAAALKSGSQVEKRTDSVSEARALLRAQTGGNHG
ncbi:hypothetical protein P1X16_01085 [Hymenobacter sp. YC55]|nr:hypothetical protein [Hymenobacter sp. YC55]